MSNGIDWLLDLRLDLVDELARAENFGEFEEAVGIRTCIALLDETLAEATKDRISLDDLPPID